MYFEQILPSPDLQNKVVCYWVVKDEDPAPRQQKIIPDGCPEIIFHFGDPYRINLGGEWVKQARSLLAGQLTKHFFLENTGVSDMLGIKFQPAAVAALFGIGMAPLTDRVVHLEEVLPAWAPVVKEVERSDNAAQRIVAIEQFLRANYRSEKKDLPVESVIQHIITSRGMLQMSEVAAALGVSTRHLEQLFTRYVGLTPKFFARIVRFNYVFELLKNQQPDWLNLVVQAGYYDQSHFIRNFKAFTGEDPTRYGFEEKSLANFFLKR